MNKKINLKEKFSKLDAYWSPRIVGEVDEVYAKIAKLKGSFTWHKHDHEDEMFFVVSGRLKIEMKTETVDLAAGEMFVVPKGVMHNPSADEECHVLVIERKATLHTGDRVLENTKSIEEQRKPI